MKTRPESAIPFSSGYSIDLYCCVDGCFIESSFGGWDGKDCYAKARKDIRKLGWILHKDGFATCPTCNKNKPK